ncbi:MAG: DUF3198 domain-containing protein [Methanomassiliicoccales archaeon]
MGKPITREYRLELSTLTLIAGLVLLLIGTAGIFFGGANGLLSPLLPAAHASGNWTYWYMVAGPILFVGGVWWLYDSLRKIRQLSKYLQVDSKAKFVKNLDEIEYLAWLLPQKYEELVLEKKRQFKM